MANKEKIGFFGGCFNPITNAHINLIKKTIEECKLDKVIFVPMGDYYKKKDLISAEERYQMLCLALENEINIEVSRIAIDARKVMHAIDTFKEIEKKYQDSENYFIMGSDNFNQIENWDSAKELIEKYNYIILDRGNIKNFNYPIVKLEDTKEISSSVVREKIKNKENLNEIIPTKVEEFILKNHLYQK